MLRNILLLTLVLCLQQTNSFAQTKPKQVVVYDIVHLKTGKVLYGEIIEFNQKDGDLEGFGSQFLKRMLLACLRWEQKVAELKMQFLQAAEY